MSEGALHLVLDLTRAEEAGDPYAFRFTTQEYLLRSAGGSVETATFKWNQPLLDDLDSLRARCPDPDAVQRVGETLRAFLKAAGWTGSEKEISAAVARGQQVIVTVRSNAAELYALPWELCTLGATGRRLGELPGVGIRYEWPGTSTAVEQPSPRPEGGRVLVAWSAAGGEVPAAEHIRAISEAAREGFHPFDFERDVLPHASYRRLREALTGAAAPGSEPFAVVHLLCHGGAVGQTFGLVLDGEDGETAVVDAGRLRKLFAEHAGRVRLVVLAACDGGNAGRVGNALGSAAQAIHRGGVAAVVAARYPLSIDSSMRLSRALYRGLFVELLSVEQAFLAARGELDRDAAHLDWAALTLHARAEDGDDSRPVVVRPYRGLRAFQPADRRFFFGREEDVERLAGRLCSGHHLLTVTGASGSGKSSLVMAGLVPLVRSGKLASGAWEVRLIRPGARPIKSLAAAIERKSEEMDPSAASTSTPMRADLADHLKRHPEALVETASRALVHAAGGRVLLVVDQFEEIFTVSTDAAESAIFIDCLLHAASAVESPVYIVMTIRADFLGHCFRFHRGLAERLGASVEVINPLSEHGLRSAILGPAALVGLRFDKVVVEMLCKELYETSSSMLALRSGTKDMFHSDDLPLLEFALDELWEKRHGDRITWEMWHAMQGMRGLVARHADRVMASFGTEEEQALSFQLFARLIRLEEGVIDTARQASRADLELIAPGHIGDVLDRWIAARLLSADDQTVRVAHEALIREWGTLRRWIGERRNALSLLAELGHSAHVWDKGDRSPDELWRGVRLSHALDLQGVHGLPVSDLEAAFLNVAESVERREKEAVEARRRREYELDPRVRIRGRTLVLLLFVLLPMGGGYAAYVKGEFTPTNTSTAAIFSIGAGVLGMMLLFGRRWLLVTRVNSVFWAMAMLDLVGAAAIHIVAEIAEVALWAANVMDLILIVSTAALFAIAIHKGYAINPAVLTISAIAILIWPASAVSITLIGLTVSLIASVVLLYLAPRRAISDKSTPDETGGQARAK